MKKIFLVFLIVFALQTASALTLSVNTTYFQNVSHDANGIDGVLFRAANNYILKNITRSPFDTAPFCLVLDSTTNLTIVNTTWTNNLCTTNIQLNQGRVYMIGTGANATSYTTSFNNTQADYPGLPTVYPNIGNFTGGCYGASCSNFAINSSVYSIVNLGIQNLTSLGVEVTLISPANNTVYSASSITFTASGNPQNLNLTNATVFVWNSAGTLVNSSVKNITGNVLNTTSWVLSNFVTAGTYLWNARFCGTNSTASNCSLGISNFSFEIGASTSNEVFNVSAYETSTQNFKITVDLLTGIELSLAQLVYNGTNYTVSNITTNGTSRILSRQIDLPLNPTALVNATRNFFWRFTFTNSQQTVQVTPTQTQEVGFINFQRCDPTYDVQALNFTLYDEVTQTNVIVNATQQSSFESSWQYWLGTGSVYRNYSFQLLNSPTNSSYPFCIFPYSNNSFQFKVNGDIDYSVINYRENQYHLRNATLTNTTNNILLYLLNEDVATKFFLTFSQGTQLIVDATITVQKFFTGLGQYLTTSILLTDSNGQATMWQDLDKDYKYLIVQNGTLLGVIERTSICSTAPCTLILTIDTSSANPFDPFYSSFAQNVLSSLTFNKTSKIVTYEFIDTTGLANYFRLWVRQSSLNQSGATICDTQLFSPSGTITCNVSAYSGEFIATGYVSRSPELTDKVLNFLSDEDIIDDLGLMGIFLVMALVIVIVFAGAVVTKGSPSGILFFLALGILILKLAHLFPFTWTTVVVLEFLIGFIIWKVKQ